MLRFILVIAFHLPWLFQFSRMTKKAKKNKKEKELPEYKLVVNMLRKRIVLGIQLLLVLGVLALMYFVPIMTSRPLFNCYNDLGNESLLTLKSLIDGITGEGVDPSLISVNGVAIFTGLPFMQTILGWFAAADQASNITVYLMLFIYGFIGFSLVLQVLICSFGMLSRKPIRGKSVKFTLVTLVISAIFIYLNLIDQNFSGYDSWIAYAFGILFIYWIVVKIMFFKEVRDYDYSKY